MGKKIVISHPTGNENTRHAVHALYAYGVLQVFVTCIACFRGNVYDLLSRIPGLSEFKKRTLDACLSKYTITYPCLELMRLIKRKVKFMPTITVDEVYHSIDRKVCGYLKRHSVDAVYAYDDGAYETFGYAREHGVKCLFDLPIVHWRCYQSLLTDEADKNPEWAETLGVFGDSKEKLARKDQELLMADCVFVASSFTKKSILEYFPYKLNASIVVVPYGFPEIFRERVYEQTTNRKLKFLFVGRLSQSKGLSYLFDAMEKFSDEIDLTIVGFNSYPNCRVLQDNLVRHRYLGTLPHDKVLCEMRKADVLIFPSLFEGFGMVITEAMSQGTPVIATDKTCAVDFIESGKNGWIVEAGSTESLVNAIDDVIGYKENLASIGRMAMETAGRRPWSYYEKELGDEIVRYLNS